MNTPITIQNLTKRFDQTLAVDDISLDIPAGSIFFLLGPSGCGKTTLLRTIAGFTEPEAGVIHFADKDITHTPANKRNTAMVFQGYALWPHLTVYQNVAFGLDIRKLNSQDKKKQTLAALERVQMLPYADRKPNALSGGQQQRVALARALVIEPTVLLLDEPLSNLDAKLRHQMRREIRSLCKQSDITAVYVTHDQKEALAIADHIAVLNDGRVIQTGTPKQLYHQPCNTFVADFLGETNFIKGTVASIENDKAILDTPLGRLTSTRSPGTPGYPGSPDNHAPGGPALAPATPVTCSLRPEAIRIDNNHASAPAENRIAAKLLETEYLGETAQHLLQPLDAQGQPVDTPPVKMLELRPRLQPESQATVQLCFDPDDLVVLLD